MNVVPNFKLCLLKCDFHFSFVTQVRKSQLMKKKKMLKDCAQKSTTHIRAGFFYSRGPIDPVHIILLKCIYCHF